MRRIVAVLLATLVAWMGFGTPAIAALEGAPAPATLYSYDSHHHATVTTGVTTLLVQVRSVTDVTAEPPEATDGVLPSLKRSEVAAKTVGEFDIVGFRSSTGYIFRNAIGHLVEDTAKDCALIQSALDPANLRTTITLEDGSTLAKHCKTLPDGTQRGSSYATARRSSTEAPMSSPDSPEVGGMALTPHQAFFAMTDYLCRYAETAGEGPTTLFGDTDIEVDGQFTDPAAWGDWSARVRRILAGQQPRTDP